MLGQDQLQVVADMGYYNHQELKKCEGAGITTYVNQPRVSKNTARGLFGKEQFVYEADRDCYRCPAQERLDFRFETEERGQRFRYYWTTACPGCALKSVPESSAAPVSIGRSWKSTGFWEMALLNSLKAR